MKVYRNGMKATEFNKGQIGMIYRLAKEGKLRVERFIMSDFYDMAEYYNYDYNGSAAEAEDKIKRILEAVSSGDLEDAQAKIDAYTERTFNLLGLKAQKAANRNIVA